MDIGKLNKRIKIVTRGTLTADGIGGYTEGTATEREVWCNARQLSQREQLLYGLEYGSSSWEFTFRKGTGYDLSQIKGLKYNSKDYRIIEVIEIENDYLKVTANVQTN